MELKTQLITIDNQQKLCYFQECKVKINTIEKCLLMEPEAEMKVIVANFDKYFFRYKNVLCILDVETNIYNFMLITRNEESCKKAFDAIQKQKSANEDNLSNDKLFEQLIYPIINGIQYNEVLKQQIMPSIIKMVDTFDEENKQKYYDRLKEDGIKENFVNEIFGKIIIKNGSKNSTSRKRKRNTDNTNDESAVADSADQIRPLHKRPNKFTAEKIDESGNFEIIEFEENGIAKQRLFIFTNSKKTKCYEYFWRNGGKYFMCGACEHNNKHTAAKIEEKLDGTKFISLFSPGHVCKPKDYNPEKYSIDLSKYTVENPNFEVIDFDKNGISKSMLIVFCPTNKQLCYKYFFDKSANLYVCCGCANTIKTRHLTAEICQRKDGAEFLKLNKADHACELRPYNPGKYTRILIHQPNYIKLDKIVNGISVKRLFIFAKDDDKKLCYMMNYDYTNKLYFCRKCRYKNLGVTAVVKIDELGPEYLALNNQHICEPIEYIPKKIVKLPDYQLLKRKSKKGNMVQKLVIFASDDKKLCYEYIWDDTLFRCLKCRHLKNRVIAKLAKTEADGEFIELCRNEHKCKPVKFVPEGNLEDKIVKESNFKIDQYTTGDGNEKKFLSIFVDADNAYTYNWRNSSKTFQCYACRRKDASYPAVLARVRQDEKNQSYVELCDYEHICDPQPYKPPTPSVKTIEASKFKIQKTIKDGIENQHLIVYASEDKQQYYSFGYLKKDKRFRCHGCDMKKVWVSARLKKNVNGEDYLEMNGTEHVCEPRNF